MSAGCCVSLLILSCVLTRTCMHAELLASCAFCALQVCVPLDPGEAWAFDPEGVVTIHDLLEGDPAGPPRAAANAAMQAALATFRRCFLTELRAASKAALLAKAKAAAAEGLAW